MAQEEGLRERLIVPEDLWVRRQKGEEEEAEPEPSLWKQGDDL